MESNNKDITITTNTTDDIIETVYKPEDEINEPTPSEIEEYMRLEQQNEQQIQPFFNISEMDKEKRQLIRQIRKYREIFNNDIITLKPFITDEKLVNYDTQYLKNLLIEIDDEISSVESVKVINNFINTGLTLYENIFVFFGIDIEGFKSDLLGDKSFNNAIARLVIRYDFNLSPEKTILLKVIENTYKHWSTSKKPKLEMKSIPAVKKTVDQSDIEKYKDL